MITSNIKQKITQYLFSEKTTTISIKVWNLATQRYLDRIKDEGRYNRSASLDDDFDPLFTHWVHLKVKNLPWHYN